MSEAIDFVWEEEAEIKKTNLPLLGKFNWNFYPVAMGEMKRNRMMNVQVLHTYKYMHWRERCRLWKIDAGRQRANGEGRRAKGGWMMWFERLVFFASDHFRWCDRCVDRRHAKLLLLSRGWASLWINVVFAALTHGRGHDQRAFSFILPTIKKKKGTKRKRGKEWNVHNGRWWKRVGFYRFLGYFYSFDEWVGCATKQSVDALGTTSRQSVVKWWPLRVISFCQWMRTSLEAWSQWITSKWSSCWVVDELLALADA